MKRTLTLAIALGVTLAVVVAGSASSLTINLGNGLTVNVPSGGILPQCADGIDNNGNGLVDMADPGCTSPLDPTESTPGTGGTGTTPGGATGGGTATAPGAAKTAPIRPGKKKGNGNSNPAGGTGGLLGPHGRTRRSPPPAPVRNPNGSPTDANPTLSVAQFGPAPLGVPNFIIDQFEIPPFLLPIYQACGTQYGIPWEVLASINRIETAFGTNLNVSTAGAVGWMQFLPSTWQAYGVDANGDGTKDPYNPVDAICAAARYLKAAGGSTDLRQGIFAYNHADWYVDEVLLYAKQYGKLPDDLVGSLTGLTEGAHFPVAAKARYADDISERAALRSFADHRRKAGNAADVISSSPTRRGINIYSKVNAPVVAVNDGVIKKIGESKTARQVHRPRGRLRQPLHLRAARVDLAGASGPQGARADRQGLQAGQPKPSPKPSQAASAGSSTTIPTKTYGNVQALSQASNSESRRGGSTAATSSPAPTSSGSGPVNTEQLRAKLFGSGGGSSKPSSSSTGTNLGSQINTLLGSKVPGYETFKATFTDAFKFDPKTMELKPLKVGSKVTGGTVLGRIGPSGNVAPHINFAIRPGRQGRSDDRPEADPRRLEAARVDGDLPRRRQEPVRGRQRRPSARFC